MISIGIGTALGPRKRRTSRQHFWQAISLRTDKGRPVDVAYLRPTGLDRVRLGSVGRSGWPGKVCNRPTIRHTVVSRLTHRALTSAYYTSNSGHQLPENEDGALVDPPNLRMFVFELFFTFGEITSSNAVIMPNPDSIDTPFAK